MSYRVTYETTIPANIALALSDDELAMVSGGETLGTIQREPNQNLTRGSDKTSAANDAVMRQ